MIIYKLIMKDMIWTALTTTPAGQKAQELINDQFAILLYKACNGPTHVIRHTYWTVARNLYPKGRSKGYL